MPIKRITKGLPQEELPAEGLLYHDKDVLMTSQRQCTGRFGMTLQLEQEAYLSQHPEVKAMLVKFSSHMIKKGKRKEILEEAAKFFTRPIHVLDSEIREVLKLPPHVPYTQGDKPTFRYKDLDLETDLRNVTAKNIPPEPWRIPSSITSTPDTASSSFVSLVTSDTTVPTPEPIPTPEPTLSEAFLGVISNTVDKAFYLRFDDAALRYDTAYVELAKAVEEAMEVPVIPIREDIARLLYNAYKFFELDIMEKERIGYETPPSPKSQLSSHESYKIPPQRPCVCQPQSQYNRYAKDRFGIYLPREDHFTTGNVTVTPALSTESLAEAAAEKSEIKSNVSKRSVHSGKSEGSKKTTTFKSG